MVSSETECPFSQCVHFCGVGGERMNLAVLEDLQVKFDLADKNIVVRQVPGSFSVK